MRENETLAWHETLELHELVAFQSVGLMKLKEAKKEIKDPQLLNLYNFSIQSLENHLRELLQFYPYAPNVGREDERADLGFYAGDLLGLGKTSVRNYAIAITETATPELRMVLVKQLNGAIKMHEQVYNFMYAKGLYPSYDLEKLLQNDVKNAHKALSNP
jgi:spore coat protein F